MRRPAERRTPALLIAAAFAAMLPAQASAHGAQVEARLAEAVAVTARFDTGEPMAGAQVAVFAPDDPRAPRLRGTADEAGRFLFLTEGAAGRWTVQVRRAGHGGIATVAVGGAPLAAAALAGDPPAITPLQRAVMAVCVLWGCLGTALYFRRGQA